MKLKNVLIVVQDIEQSRQFYDLMAWIFCQQTMKTDVLSVESAAKAINGMRQDYFFSSVPLRTIPKAPCGRICMPTL